MKPSQSLAALLLLTGSLPAMAQQPAAPKPANTKVEELGEVVITADAEKAFFIPHAEVTVGDNGLVRHFEVPIRLPATVDLKVSATSLANNTRCSCGLRGWYES